MSGKRNWRKAQLHGKRSISCLDEQEYRDRDAAARWLERKFGKHKVAVNSMDAPKRKRRSPNPLPTEAVQQ